MDDEEKNQSPVEDTIVVATSHGNATAEAEEEATFKQETPATDTALASRPLRSLRSAGRAAEDKIIKKTAKIITKRPQRKWDAQRLLTDPKSPLAKANLRAILSNPMAWDCLNTKERDEVLSLFPDQRHLLAQEDGTSRPNTESLMNDDSFRYDCAAYTDSLAQGRHDPEWLAQAWAAHERRKAGDFDEYIRRKFEQDWEAQLPEDDDTGAAARDSEETVLAEERVGETSSRPAKRGLCAKDDASADEGIHCQVELGSDK